jgi:pimeloyl-ACP methyl ester carboxylesterase
MDATLSEWQHTQSPGGVRKAAYRSPVDGFEDWALLWPGRQSAAWVVQIHGHGSQGDQAFVRQDIRDLWLPVYQRLGVGLVAPNLRGNAWMGPAAAADLHALLMLVRERFGAKRFVFHSGSMGGSSNLIYAVCHPEDVAAVWARCPVTDIGSYYAWCVAHPGGTVDEIAAAIRTSYGGTPAENPDVYATHSTLAHADRLTMPVVVIHGDADTLIPVDQSRRLAERMKGQPNFRYAEMPGGHHDSPLAYPGLEKWLTQALAAPHLEP